MSNLNPVTMTAEEAEFIMAYRLADARGKEAIMSYARGMAEDWPEPRRAKVVAEDDSGGGS